MSSIIRQKTKPRPAPTTQSLSFCRTPQITPNELTTPPPIHTPRWTNSSRRSSLCQSPALFAIGGSLSANRVLCQGGLEGRRFPFPTYASVPPIHSFRASARRRWALASGRPAGPAQSSWIGKGASSLGTPASSPASEDIGPKARPNIQPAQWAGRAHALRGGDGRRSTPWVIRHRSVRPRRPRELFRGSMSHQFSRPFRPHMPGLRVVPGHRPAAVGPGLDSAGPLGRAIRRLINT